MQPLGCSFLLLLTRNCNSSPFCSVHIVLSYVQFGNSSWFKIVLSDLYSLMIKRCKLHSSIPFQVWYCPGGALLILDSHLQNFHPTNHMSIRMDFHQFYAYGFQLLSMMQHKLQVIDNRSSFCVDDVHQKPSSSKIFIARECKRVIVHRPSSDLLPAYLTT